MKNIALLLSCCTLLPLSLSAQKIEVKQQSVNCGQVLFRHPVTAEYQFTNTGGHPLVISDVRTSCGCTTVDYPRQPIAEDSTFVIRAVYDALQMGHFTKQVAVYSNASKEPLMLTMRGIVVGEIVDFFGDYAYTMGDLQTDINNIEFDDVNKGDRPMQKIHIRNNSDLIAEPQVMHLPNYLQAEVSPSRIAPGRSGIVTITLDSRKLRDYGLAQTSVYLGFQPGDKVSPTKEITLSAVLLPDFSQLTEDELREAPRLQLSTRSLDLGSFAGKKKLKGEIIVQNVGQSELDVQHLQVYTVGIGVSLNKTHLLPGESAKMKITADARQLKMARSKPRVLMITNDPNTPKVIIEVNATD